MEKLTLNTKHICYDRCFIKATHEGKEVFIPMLLRGIPGKTMSTMNIFFSVRKQAHKEWTLACGDSGKLWFSQTEIEALYPNSSMYDEGYMTKDGIDMTRADFSKWMLKGLKNRTFTVKEFLFMKNSLQIIFSLPKNSKRTISILDEEDLFKNMISAQVAGYTNIHLAFKQPDVKYPQKQADKSAGTAYYVIYTGSGAFFSKFSSTKMYGYPSPENAKKFETEEKAYDYIDKNIFKFGQKGYEVKKVSMDADGNARVA